MSANPEHYFVKAEIGKGAYGVAFKVVANQSCNAAEFSGIQEYVIKTVDLAKIDQHDQHGENERRRCRNMAIGEAVMLKELNHANIVKSFDYYVTDSNMLIISMEYCAAGTLKGYLMAQKSKSVDEGLIVNWTGQLLGALVYLEQKRILHRDIKNENIFLAEGGDIVKLGDFGVAKQMLFKSALNLTIIGTMTHLAPEMVDEQPYDSKADVWSLGVCLYQLMTGQLPFIAPNAGAITRAILSKTPAALPQTFHPALRGIVDSMLTKDPANRPHASSILPELLDLQKLSLAKRFQTQNSNPTNKDRKGVARGRCKNRDSNNEPCDCDEFTWTPGNADAKCEMCGHFPSEHCSISGETLLNASCSNHVPLASSTVLIRDAADETMKASATDEPNNDMNDVDIPPERICMRMKRTSTLAESANSDGSKYDIYKPKMDLVYEQEFELPATPGVGSKKRFGGVRKYIIGNEENSAAERKLFNVIDVIILVVGATGSGKTTFINGFANYLFNVEKTDPFRFKIITAGDEESEAGEMESKTRFVSAYVFVETIHPNFRLTIVDTPGFGDTNGLQYDKMTSKFIEEWFKKTGSDGLDHLNGVCFVVKHSTTRLTPETAFQINQVMSVFGKDMAENIVPTITFCDMGKSPAVKALSEQNIPFGEFFRFNNCGIFPSSGDDEDFEDSFWRLGEKSYEKFCNHLLQLPPTSLKLTKQVLLYRRELEDHVISLKRKVDEQIAKLEAMRQDVKLIKEYEAEIARNENFQVVRTVPKIIQVPIPNNRYTTLCLTCSATCHDKCTIADDDKKAGCIAIDRNGKCKVCPGKCCWNIHKNLRFVFETEFIEETLTLDDLKAKYTFATDGKATAHTMLQRAADGFAAGQLQMHSLIKAIRDSINELNQTAIAENKLTSVDYVRNMIEAEKLRKRPGYQDRIKHLKVQLGVAETLAQLAAGENDPFEAFRTDHEGLVGYLEAQFPQVKGLLEMARDLFRTPKNSNQVVIPSESKKPQKGQVQQRQNDVALPLSGHNASAANKGCTAM